MTRNELEARILLVKETLPEMEVELHDGTRLRGRLSGRLLDFAHLSVLVHGSWLGAGEWSWDTIAQAHAAGHALKG